MKRTLPIALILFIFSSSLLLPAQDILELDADTAVALALRGNLGIAVEELSLEMKRRMNETVYNVLYPQIQVGASLTRMNEAPSAMPDFSSFPIISYPTPPHTFNLGASISASLPLSISMIHGIRLVRQDYQMGLLGLETARKKLTLAVKKSFYSLLVLEEAIALAEQNLAAATTRYEQALANYQSGLVDEYSLLAAQVAMESIRPAVEEARNMYRTALLAFKMDLGLDYNGTIHLSGSVEPEIFRFDAEALSRGHLVNNPDIQTLIQGEKMAENQIKLQNSYLYPVLSFMYSMDPTFSGDPFKDSWFSEDWTQRTGMFGIALSLSLDNLLPGSKARNEIHRAENDREGLRIRLAQALRGTELEVRRIVMNLEKSEKAILALESNLDLADKANRLGQEAYRAGLREYSQIEATELALREARLNVLREKFNYLTNLLDLEYTLNTSLETMGGIQK